MSKQASEFQEKSMNKIFRVKTDGFHGELFCPAQDVHPEKVLICFSGSDGRFEWSRKVAAVFQAHGLTTLALAYVMEEGLPKQFCRVPMIHWKQRQNGYMKWATAKWGYGVSLRGRN